MSEYKVKFEVFEGPLDLLLYLVKKEEVDIYEVDLTRLATQFIEYVEMMRQLDLDVAGEFLVMAATLMYIKSRELLPKEQQVQSEEEEDQEDPRWELIRKLVEYKKFKDAAAQLQQREIEMEFIYPRRPGKIELNNNRPAPKVEASIFDLLNAVNTVLRRISQRDDPRDIFEDKFSVSEKFSELFVNAVSRPEVICTFLALLELIRLKQLVCMQGDEFGDIEITKAPPQPVAPVEEIVPNGNSNPQLN